MGWCASAERVSVVTKAVGAYLFRGWRGFDIGVFTGLGTRRDGETGQSVKLGRHFLGSGVGINEAGCDCHDGSWCGYLFRGWRGFYFGIFTGLETGYTL